MSEGAPSGHPVPNLDPLPAGDAPVTEESPGSKRTAAEMASSREKRTRSKPHVSEDMLMDVGDRDWERMLATPPSPPRHHAKAPAEGGCSASSSSSKASKSISQVPSANPAPHRHELPSSTHAYRPPASTLHRPASATALCTRNLNENSYVLSLVLISSQQKPLFIQICDRDRFDTAGLAPPGSSPPTQSALHNPRPRPIKGLPIFDPHQSPPVIPTLTSTPVSIYPQRLVIPSLPPHMPSPTPATQSLEHHSPARTLCLDSPPSSAAVNEVRKIYQATRPDVRIHTVKLPNLRTAAPPLVVKSKSKPPTVRATRSPTARSGHAASPRRIFYPSPGRNSTEPCTSGLST